LDKPFSKKRFGQNFLVDERVVDRLISAISPRSNETIIEIGPGPGALTGGLVERFDKCFDKCRGLRHLTS